MSTFLSNTTFLWLALMVVFIVIELMTVSLTTIWFAGGSLLATIMSVLGLPFFVQIIIFFIVSIVLLIFTRPLVEKYINTKHVKTNYESIIGKTAKVMERIDNIAATGSAKIDGQDWTARSVADEIIIDEGALVKVVEISGVKIIVEEIKGEN